MVFPGGCAADLPAPARRVSARLRRAADGAGADGGAVHADGGAVGGGQGKAGVLWDGFNMF